jgi:hypothetical protein
MGRGKEARHTVRFSAAARSLLVGAPFLFCISLSSGRSLPWQPWMQRVIGDGC